MIKRKRKQRKKPKEVSARVTYQFSRVTSFFCFFKLVRMICNVIGRRSFVPAHNKSK